MVGYVSQQRGIWRPGNLQTLQLLWPHHGRINYACSGAQFILIEVKIAPTGNVAVKIYHIARFDPLNRGIRKNLVATGWQQAASPLMRRQIVPAVRGSSKSNVITPHASERNSVAWGE